MGRFLRNCLYRRNCSSGKILGTLFYLKTCSTGTIPGSVPSVNLPQELQQELFKELFKEKFCQKLFLKKCSRNSSSGINKYAVLLPFEHSCDLQTFRNIFGLLIVLAEHSSTCLSSGASQGIPPIPGHIITRTAQLHSHPIHNALCRLI